MPESSDDPDAASELDYPPLMREQLAALWEYAIRHGEGWKSQLRKDWLSPLLDPLLGHLHNSHGPGLAGPVRVPGIGNSQT